jgi:hypothetical protein
MRSLRIGTALSIAMLVGAGVLLGQPASAQEEIVTVFATLDGGQENPPIRTGSFGKAVFVVNRTLGTISYTINIYRYPSGVTQAHIHVSPRGVNGPVVLPIEVPVGTSGDFSLQGTLDRDDFVPRLAEGIGTLEDALFSITGGTSYVNIHSQVNPGGEIRGQICPVSEAANTLSSIAVCRTVVP